MGEGGAVADRPGAGGSGPAADGRRRARGDPADVASTPAVDATAAAAKTAIEKLAYLRNMDAHKLDLSMLPTERLRFLAAVGRRSTSQALQRRDGDRRYPILLALVAQSAVDQLDEVVALRICGSSPPMCCRRSISRAGRARPG